MKTIKFGRILGVLGALALSLALGVLFAPAALAHATYKSSNPPDESTVSSPPSEITAEFTEPMSDGSYMDVTDPCGRDVGSGSEQMGASMRVQNSGTAAGTYRVYWRAVSIDSHVTEGEFTFTSRGGDPCPGEESEEEKTTGGDGGAGSSGADDGTSETGDAGTQAVAAAKPGQEGHSRRQHGKHGAGVQRGDSRRKKSTDSSDGNGSLTQGERSDVPGSPSALEGIPLDGLVITLGVSALIGAAAGKIYVSLSGDGS